MPRQNRTGFTVNHQAADGSRVIVSQQRRPQGQAALSGYREVENPRDGSRTRIHLNGQRVERTHDFERRGFLGGPSYVTRHSGLRESTLADGRSLYRERYAMERDRDGHTRRVIRRTVFGILAAGAVGAAVMLAAPQEQIYDAVPAYGAETYVYRPPVQPVALYGALDAPFATAIPAACANCPPPAVAYDQPVQAYSDPMELMGDLQLEGAFDDGARLEAAAQTDGGTDMVQLRQQVSMLGQQLDTNAQANTQLATQLGGKKPQIALPQAAADRTPVTISNDVRDLMRKQVRLSVAQHRNNKALVLGDIIGSGYARIYLFQASEPLAVADSATGEECTLNVGDLTSFAELPAPNSTAALMKVVASRPGSCPEQATVEIRFGDLQEMLNGFSQRVEANMAKVSACATRPAACARR